MPVLQSPACRRFRNALAILHSIDEREYERATGLGEVSWRRFRENPAAEFVSIDNGRAEAIWQLIEAGQPRELRTGSSHSVAAE